MGFEKEWCGEAAFGQSGGLFENDVGKALQRPAERNGEKQESDAHKCTANGLIAQLVRARA